MIVYDRFIDSIIGSIYRSIFEDPEAAPAAIIVEKWLRRGCRRLEHVCIYFLS